MLFICSLEYSFMMVLRTFYKGRTDVSNNVPRGLQRQGGRARTVPLTKTTGPMDESPTNGRSAFVTNHVSKRRL